MTMQPAFEFQQWAKPLRLGFLGTGWIGRHRMEAIVNGCATELVAICEPEPAAADSAVTVAPGAVVVPGLDAMLGMELDGVVIATPSALHAEQAIQCLAAGIAVFCQKPLGRNAEEVEAVIEAARHANLLLGLDLSYRHARGTELIRDQIRQGGIGRVHGVDLIFHNAYGPDKPWFYDARLSGGGCMIDLGTHLVDLALWTLGFPPVISATGHLFRKGTLLFGAVAEVEDYAVATLETQAGCVLRLACSWGAHAGYDAEIQANFYGTSGGLCLRNVNGSFFDFTVDAHRGTARERLIDPPDDWGGRAAVAWAKRLARDPGYDDDIESIIQVAHILDAIYRR